jgi:pilus assembly protein FimV
LEHRSNGQAYLRILGQRPVNEPFLGIVIDANWAKGRVVRDYTLLIDPPHQRAPAPVAPPPQRKSAPVLPSSPQPHLGVAVPTPESAPASASGPSSTTSGTEGQVRVQRGDTAAAIAAAHKVEGVSLDQMLVALLRANPDAFIRGNVNLIRAGAVLDLPTADQAAAVPDASARQQVIAQSRDFNKYRQGLAGTAAGRRMSASDHSATGKVQPAVQITRLAPKPSDILKIGHSVNDGSRETNAAQQGQLKDLSEQNKQLRSTIDELNNKLKQINNPPVVRGLAIKPPVLNGVVPPPIAVASAPPANATPTARPASFPVPPAFKASTPVAPKSLPRPIPHRPHIAPPEPSLMDTLLSSPLKLGLGAVVVLIIVLVGYVFYRNKQKKGGKGNETRLDSISGSKLSPDSYFGSSGGQRVDTRDGGNSSGGVSSMAYSPSQLEAVGDIDPVSEADVYLAYGRDAQAEEILKEALRTYPGRASIYVKLAEIYAKQHDTHQLEAIATEARRVTHGEGQDWQTIVNLGQGLDPANSLYASNATRPGKAPEVAQQPHIASNASSNTQSSSESHGAQNALDLDLTEHTPFPATTPQTIPQPLPDQSLQHAPTDFLSTFPSSTPDLATTEPLPLPPNQGTAVPEAPYAGDIDFAPPAIQPQTPSHSGTIEFDSNALTASSTSHPDPAQTNASPPEENPLLTKFALAQEFHAIGDNTSARSLTKEVLAEATGALKAKAEQFLGTLG